MQTRHVTVARANRAFGKALALGVGVESFRMVIKHGHWTSTNGGFSGKHITFIKMLDILLPCLIDGTSNLMGRTTGPRPWTHCVRIDDVFTLRICSVLYHAPFSRATHVIPRKMVISSQNSWPSAGISHFLSTQGSQALILWTLLLQYGKHRSVAASWCCKPAWWWTPDGNFMITPIYYSYYS